VRQRRLQRRIPAHKLRLLRRRLVRLVLQHRRRQPCHVVEPHLPFALLQLHRAAAAALGVHVPLDVIGRPAARPRGGERAQ